MADYGAEYTDKKIEKIEKQIKKVYSQADKEITKEWKAFSKKFIAQDKIKKKDLKKGKISQEDYDKWFKNKILKSDDFQKQKEHVLDILTDSNKKAIAIANGETKDVFATNANYEIYEIDQKAGGIGYSWDIYDSNAVSRLIADNPRLLPAPKINVSKDKAWNIKNFNTQLTQSIIRGESIDKLAKRLSSVTGRNESHMMLHARTMMTGAQNAGRLEGMNQAKRLGINVYKKWLSAHDGHTRIKHLQLDDQDPIPVEEPFEVGGESIDYPGDPYAPPGLVYNCRCTMYSEIMDEDGNPLYSIDEDELESIGFEDWIDENTWNIVEGHDISDTWTRRNNEFDFEIEDVINAQGFDGKPRIVSSEEFEKLVKEANGGNGFIAQRTYSASTQEVLQSYRDQLYNGKWYVDCSTGGAQYGQGMYCAADYNGIISDGIKNEMKHYQMLNSDKLGNISNADLRDILKSQKNMENEILNKFKNGELSKKQGIEMYNNIKSMQPSEYLANYMKDNNIVGARSFTETMTLDSSAKIVNYIDIKDEKNRDLNNIRMSYVEESAKSFEKFNELSKNESEIYRSILNDTIRYGNPIHPGINTGLDEDTIQYFLEDAREKAQMVNSLIGTNEKYNSLLEMDIGSYATLKGYDAINAEGHGASGSYTVILNRTKVIIKGD